MRLKKHSENTIPYLKMHHKFGEQLQMTLLTLE